MQRIAAQDVTEAIAKAMENAERMKNCIIVYETFEDDDVTHGVIIPGQAKLADINFLIDVAKEWIFST